MFTPAKITSLALRSSPRTLILRGILVTAVVMALLATLAGYPSGSSRDASSPYRIPWEETLGASVSPDLPRLEVGDLGQGQARESRPNSHKM